MGGFVASNALGSHLVNLLQDPEDLLDVASQLPANYPGRQQHQEALNRSVIVTAVSAWEAFVEAIVRESIDLLCPPAPLLGPWPTHKAAILGQLGRFNTPDLENVRSLLSNALGLPNIPHFWAWQNVTTTQARDRLAEVMKLRHEVAHGVHPRPNVASFYASTVPDFFREMGRCTDRAVRHHLVNVLGIANPWPP